MKTGAALVLALVLPSIACGASSATPDATSEPRLRPKPRLAIGPLFPLTVRGSGFKANERVTVTLDGGRRGKANVRADRAGGFVTRHPIRLGRCGTVTIRAVGSAGSRVVYQPPRPDCREP
jgi:hypothetical protein